LLTAPTVPAQWVPWPLSSSQPVVQLPEQATAYAPQVRVVGVDPGVDNRHVHAGAGVVRRDRLVGVHLVDAVRHLLGEREHLSVLLDEADVRVVRQSLSRLLRHPHRRHVEVELPNCLVCLPLCRRPPRVVGEPDVHLDFVLWVCGCQSGQCGRSRARSDRLEYVTP